MDFFSISTAASVFRNREIIHQTLRWLDGDAEAFQTPEQKIQKLRAALKTVAEAQENALNRIAIWLAICVSVSLASLGVSLFVLLHRAS